MEINSQISTLSSAFSKNIRQNLTEEELAKVTQANKSNPEEICATHDLIDSNICMSDAFLEVNGRPIDLQATEDLDLVNQAWKTSKEKGFRN